MAGNPVRRLFRNDRGKLEEVGPVGPGGADDEDRTPETVVEPSGQPTPRFKAFAPRVTPPKPSPQYQRDARYASQNLFVSATRMQAIQNWNRWNERHGQAMSQVCGWLAVQGCLGDDTKAAYVAQSRSAEARAQAGAAVEEAKAAHIQAKQHLAETAFAYLESPTAPRPTGLEVVAAGRAVEGAQLAAEAVAAACQRADMRWGKSLARVSWPEALNRAQQAKRSDESEAAVAWLRAKVYPPPGPTEDPLGWL